MQHEARPIPTILVTGSNGQIGFELQRSIAPLARLVALDRASCDLARPDELRRLMRLHRPDVIINAAAFTAVDRAEEEVEAAYAINGVAPGILAEEAEALGSLLVHYSTDYVFDGRKTQPYVEADAPNPLSVYGQSKFAGEQAIATIGCASLILRTSWVAGAHGRNFAKTILALARKGDQLRVVADQFGAPTTAALVADTTAQIVSRSWLNGDRAGFPSGTFHLTAGGRTSWHGYACEVLRHAHARGVALTTGPQGVQPIETRDAAQLALRPSNSVLDTARLQETFGIYLPDWKQGVHLLLDQIFS
ncbi:dTDP-4-dehydrorhamnose reductase [Cupriavidus sp. CV2]|uniref:dTDP-4-dehydrorhamnose reductase n=1 Tax=Cupriavidus ulmosensis TaxID=3065913 RepID=UPI00296AABE9|nr:dTDP-4-dehydrorhamnose reductase [Cupriavidus sp. CV2]MDW3681748.1 dTDP-4-dehydrorhamnose reductase [Cupriavidus sp. CV2]